MATKKEFLHKHLQNNQGNGKSDQSLSQECQAATDSKQFGKKAVVVRVVLYEITDIVVKLSDRILFGNVYAKLRRQQPQIN